MSAATTHSPHVYIHCDVPNGVTLVEWRRGRGRERRLRTQRSVRCLLRRRHA